MLGVGKVFVTGIGQEYLVVSSDFTDLGKGKCNFAVIYLRSMDIDGYYSSLKEIEVTYDVVGVREFIWD